MMDEAANKALLLVAEVMTSGIKQEGATFTLPESMIIELVARAKAQERTECQDLLTRLRGLPDAGMAYAAELIKQRGRA
jgi:hypothetical protein